ncbi:hypothetical protein [Desulfovibrio gilichinskyi]|uniref:Uncharacterized protein n=1 Tax=Desulfovibrio gilichinskyi TaxID=1519643 RepID=A0A1X7CGR2_9BACT|nr:hypothetical protein [Desulfovibrio gilichinskyi]SME96369.1 hypothetical protein SAMN06295933_0881 [Desulfovibrio gilichinskyi]
MSININDMTIAEKKRLAAELAPFILNELGNSSEIILPGTEKSVKLSVRLIDSGKISNQTRSALDAAEAAYEAATNVETRKSALKNIFGIFRIILMGRNN